MSAADKPKNNDKSNKSIKDLWIANKYLFIQTFTYHKKLFWITFILSILVAFSPYLQRAVEAFLINYISANLTNLYITTELILLILLIPLVILFNNIISISDQHFNMAIWRDMRTRFDIVFFNKLASLDVATHEDPKFKDKVNLVQENGSSFVLSNFYGKTLRNFQNVIGFIIAAVVMLNVDWKIFVIILIAVIPRFIVELKYGETAWSIYQTHSQAKRHMWHAKRQLDDAEGIREVHTYGTTKFFLDRIKKILDEFHLEQLIKDRRTLKWRAFAQAIIALSFGLIGYLLIMLIINDGMQVGTFVFVLASAFGLQQTLMGFLLSISGQYQDAKTISAFIEIMNEERRIALNENYQKLELNSAPEIIFENVSFAYPSDPTKFVLKNFNLKISPGEKLAIVGANGAGKTTFIKLLCRFYDPSEGRILINGINLKELSVVDWYRHIALLAQDYRTYKLPVKELVHLGKIEAPLDVSDITSASVQADADEFIRKWEKQYEQQIGVEFDEGIDPSQGQKQKLALARAIFRKAFVTILDEPTASVDAKAEKQIFEQLEKIMDEKRTLILISHRFATVRNADKIIVFEGQNIKESGTHKQLIANNGLYKQMYTAQAEGYKD